MASEPKPVAVALSARLDSAAQTVAQLLGERAEEVIAGGSRAALRLLAKHHPDASIREKASTALK